MVLWNRSALRLRRLARAVAAAAVVLAGAAAVLGTATPAAFAAAASPVTTPLAGLPSPPGPHLARLSALAPGAWLDLGRPAADPRWGRARGRTWTSVMPYAAGLDVAFLFGEGVHGWVNPETGRYMDDLWAYDINAHRWIAVHPGTDTRSPPTLTLNADGFVANSAGAPLPVATMVHGYGMTTWDPERRLFMSMENRHEYFKKALPTVAAFLTENHHRINRDFASPWMFAVDAGTWQRHKTKTPSPKSGFGDTLIYLSSRDALFFRHGSEVWFYQIAANTWQRATPAGPPPPFGIDANACYDPRRDRVYLGGGGYPVAPGPNALWIYDLKANRWIDPAPGGVPVGVGYATNVAMLHCDLGRDLVILIRHKGNQRGLFAYDPEANLWRAAGSLPAAWRHDYTTNGSSGFYAGSLGVHLFHVAGDSSDQGRILAWRAGP